MPPTNRPARNACCVSHCVHFVLYIPQLPNAVGMPESWCLDCMTKLRSLVVDIEKFRRSAAYWQRFLSERALLPPIEDGNTKSPSSSFDQQISESDMAAIHLTDVIVHVDDTESVDDEAGAKDVAADEADAVEDDAADVDEENQSLATSKTKSKVLNVVPKSNRRSGAPAAQRKTIYEQKTTKPVVVRRKNHECDYCGFRTAFKRHMVAHFRRTHGWCKFECVDCKRTFRGP